MFGVSLYGKGALLDLAEGDPSIIWEHITAGKAPRRRLVAPYQEHGTTVIPADIEFSLPRRPGADGVYLEGNSGACASLRFADCAPVVVAGGGESPFLLILHSGFAGTVKNISGQSLAKLLKERKNKTGALYAWIAPAICRNCYFRGKEDPAAAKAMGSFSSDNYSAVREHIHFDIKGEIHRQITACGVQPENIFMTEFCTRCDNDKFYSYRAGDEKRRNFLLAMNTTNGGI